MRLGVLVNPSVPLVEKTEVAQAFHASEDCCCPGSDGFTSKLKAEVELSGETVQPPRTRAFLEYVFAMTGNSKLMIDDRFARHRKHYQPNENTST